MKNPFPGMNPWLELDWPEAHSSMIVYCRDQLQAQLPPGLRARVEQGVGIDAEDEFGVGRLVPDVHVSEAWDGGSGGVAVMEAVEASTGLIAVETPPVARHIEISDAHGVVVTAIEFLSPANKKWGNGFEAYRAKQKTYLSAGVNLVEIDLLRGGLFALAISEGNFPTMEMPLYKALVFRARRPQVREIFPIKLRDHLPRLPIPLRPTDREVVLDLQPLVDRCCVNGAYGPRDYRRPLSPPLEPEDEAWVRERLAESGMLGEQ